MVCASLSVQPAQSIPPYCASNRQTTIAPSGAQATRRWEKATPAMMRDPLLSTLVHLKPPGMVYGHGLKGNGGVHGQPARKQAQTLDGQKIGDAYRARAQGTRG
eukprot:scaffold131904_cov36-Tisochrysis_lutea.AAC.6